MLTEPNNWAISLILTWNRKLFKAVLASEIGYNKNSVKIYNSLSKKLESFEPIRPPNVGVYTCGMTVYDYAHIGHGRKYVGDDILIRTLKFNGFKVKHVQNVTDVGHLTSDADTGEDKLEKGARKTGKTVWEVAEYFTNHFYSSMDKLNVERPDIIAKATDNIDAQINLVDRLVNKGYGYETDTAVYFDTSKFDKYDSIFKRQKSEEKKEAVRDELKVRKEKRNPTDFALWIKRVGDHANHTMHWDSPWGDGFPGWHVECSAMSMKYLGDQFDIHTGGEDHVPVHHPNEIAQSEAASGKSPFAKYWVHHAFLKVDGKKMSKSLGNFYTIEDVAKKGFDPLALRYLYLTAHYRDQLNFTWDSLSAAQNTLNKLRSSLEQLKNNKQRTVLSAEKSKKTEEFRNKFEEVINNDLNTPQALAVMWEALKSNIPSEDKYDLAIMFDEVFGLRLRETKNNSDKLILDKKAEALLQKREDLRSKGNFDEADKIRVEIEKKGYKLIDTSEGTKVQKK